MQVIRDEYLRAYLLIERRIAFFQRKQESNQTVADHIADIHALGAEADLQNLTMDDLYMLQLIVTMKEERITEDLIHKKNLNKVEFFNHALDIRALYSAAKDIKETKLVQVNNVTQQHKGKHGHKSQQ